MLTAVGVFVRVVVPPFLVVLPALSLQRTCVRDIVTKEFPKGKKTYVAGDEFAPPSSDAKSLIGMG